MATWQRKARLLIALAAAAFAVVVALAFRERTPPSPKHIAPTDPKAIVESTTGRTIRLNREQEEVRIEYEKLLTYQDSSSKLIGVTVVTERAGGRTFTIKGKQGQIEGNESIISVVGDVLLTASDGMAVRTERAIYTESDGMVRAAGPVEFSRGRLSGSGIGLTYDKNRDVLAVLEQVVVHVAPGESKTGAMEISAGSLELSRLEHIIRFPGTMTAVRGSQTIAADAAAARLSEDEERLETLELRGNSRITGAGGGAGGVQALTGRDIDLKYAADGETLEHALIAGDAAIQLAGEGGQAGRRIAGGILDLGLGPDGTSPTLLTGRENVELTFPAEQGAAARTIRAQTLDAKGEAGRGLTSARFSGNVQFRERGADTNREARSGLLDLALAPGLSAIDEASFSRGVRFVDGAMTATAAVARYAVLKGTLELSGGDPGQEMPRVVNQQVAVDARRIDVTLAGPLLKASGAVRSQLTPSTNAGAQPATKSVESKLPSMLKEDQPAIVTAAELAYDAPAATAAYTGNAQLYQGDTSIKGAAILIDEKTGDLSATGPVTTAIALEQETKDKRKERVRSIASAKDFKYQEAGRRATYTGEAHVIGSQGDMTAEKIELYLKPSGEELERVEAYDNVTLRDQNRKTTGTRMTYFSADERYVVTGTPVMILDECGRETTGRTLTFYKAADRIVVDGNEQIRTQTRGATACP